MDNLIKQDLTEAREILDQFINTPGNIDNIVKAGDILVQSLKSGGKAISCGNGGSMSDAMHFAEELTGYFRGKRDSVAAIAISDPTHITCVANDDGFDKIFSRYLEAVGKPGEVLLAISTSGNSGNVVEAAKTAREKGMKIIALTGKTGGQLANLADVEIRAPHSSFSDRVQEIHIKVIHALIHYIEEHL
ncbi:MAG: D-sedoheptulose 7-phosphate isomerase [Bacteroidota bacterium]